MKKEIQHGQPTETDSQSERERERKIERKGELNTQREKVLVLGWRLFLLLVDRHHTALDPLPPPPSCDGEFLCLAHLAVSLWGNAKGSTFSGARKWLDVLSGPRSWLY